MARIPIYYVVICSYPFNQIAGESRGFAFVAFSTVDEARKWLDIKQVDTSDTHNDGDPAKSSIYETVAKHCEHVKVSQIELFTRT